MSYQHNSIFSLSSFNSYGSLWGIYPATENTSKSPCFIHHSPSKQWYTPIQRMLICVYSVFVWMCVNICDKSTHSMMPSEWTSCMNRPSGPSCWRKLSARRRKWWCLLPCRYRQQVCLCENREYTVLVNVHVCLCSKCLLTIESYHLLCWPQGTSFNPLLSKQHRSQRPIGASCDAQKRQTWKDERKRKSEHWKSKI